MQFGETVVASFLRWRDAERESDAAWDIRSRFAWLAIMAGVIGVATWIPLVADGEWVMAPGGTVLAAGGVSGLRTLRYRWDVPASRRHTAWSALALVVAPAVIAVLWRVAGDA